MTQAETLTAPHTGGPLGRGKYQIMPDMTPDEYASLKEDIRQNGVKLPIEFDSEGNLLDGHHRHRAFGELIAEGEDLPMFDKIVRPFQTEEEKWNHVISINVNRRHLTAEQRQQLVIQLRMPPFNYSLQKIADTVHISVATAWRDLDEAPEELKEELRTLKTVGADGREYVKTFTPRVFFTGETQLRHAEAEAKGVEQQAAFDAASQGGGASGGGFAEGAATRYAIVVECKDEAEQADLLERLMEEGYDVKALVL